MFERFSGYIIINILSNPFYEEDEEENIEKLYTDYISKKFNETNFDIKIINHDFKSFPYFPDNNWHRDSDDLEYVYPITRWHLSVHFDIPKYLYDNGIMADMVDCCIQKYINDNTSVYEYRKNDTVPFSTTIKPRDDLQYRLFEANHYIQWEA